MMKRFLGSKAAARLLSFLLAFSLLFCQLPVYAWADDISAGVSEEATTDLEEVSTSGGGYCLQ